MSFPGYAGDILYVDLTTETTISQPLAPESIQTFIGGWGIMNKLAYDLIPSRTDPFSPQNAIILGTGPFTGTIVPGSGKVFTTTKFPVNGAFATAAGGGHFGLSLKTSGYDYLVITGKASKPVYLKIHNNNVEFHDARKLWGKDNFTTVDELRLRYEPCSIIPIGQAGENLVRFSITFIDKGGTLGRGGLPAVMGAKNLKAIVAAQGTKGIKVANYRQLHQLVHTLMGRINAWAGRQPLLERGIGGQFLESWGDIPRLTNNLTQAHIMNPTERQKLEDFLNDYQKHRKTLTCASCPLGDKEVTRYGGVVSYGNCVGDPVSEYALKSALEGLDKGMEYINLLNKYGIDFMTFEAIASFLIHLYRKGVISARETDGIALEDNPDTIVRLITMIAYRQGFGNILADGFPAILKWLGKGQEYANQVKNQGLVRVFDPRLRGLGTMEMTQVTNPRGAHVAAGGSPAYLSNRPPSDFVRHAQRMGFSEQAIKRAATETNVNIGRYLKCSEDWYSVFNCLGLCNRAMVNRFYHVNTLAELYSAITGINTTAAELMKAADRAYTLYKVLNVKAGFGRKDDSPPKVWFQPLKVGEKEYQMTNYFKTAPITRGSFNRLLDDYYDERGWDKKTGIPTPQKLVELGLEDIAHDLGN
jgi:aldehyde:ferredoxin oxidoreductase